MKVIGFIGSPRKDGNTTALVGEVLAGAKSKGAETKTYNLCEMDIGGCQACYECREKPGCRLKDDMQKLYKEIQSADAIVLGSPVYMWQMSGQAKIFVDRLLPYMNSDFKLSKTGKKEMILIFCQGQDNPAMFISYFESTGEMFESLGFHVKELLVASSMDEAGDAAKKKELIKKANDLGRELLG
jgi:multimeric flavodoxin WrbA